VRVLIAGGGTAGHVTPAIALGRVLRRRHDADVRFLGTPAGPEARLVPAAGFRFIPMDARPLRREVSVAALTSPFASVRSILRCAPFVSGADVVVGTGGYVSAPAALAAVRARRPLVVHEQNAVPGLANRLVARWAHTVALTFEEAAQELPRGARSIVVGNPVRDEILAVRTQRDRLSHEAEVELGLEPGRRTVLVFGGSQGARHLDEAVAGALGYLHQRDDLQLLVLLGQENRALLDDAEPGALVVRSRAFLDRMELAYAASDLVVARAGASSIAEIAVCARPALLVPYPHGRADEQEANARALERLGAARVLPDPELSSLTLARLITELVDDQGLLDSMGSAAAAWARPDAAEALADVVLDALGSAT
jgi:UDP-N-acetylglucosamine--N-acetylmuramyl-(pentapeptide) pyrophosphoryl-undecaprenol N-acetylglucosamine transferase